LVNGNQGKEEVRSQIHVKESHQRAERADGSRERPNQEDKGVGQEMPIWKAQSQTIDFGGLIVRSKEGSHYLEFDSLGGEALLDSEQAEQMADALRLWAESGYLYIPGGFAGKELP